VVGEGVELPDADVLGGLVCCAEGENGASDESRRHETLRTAVSELRDAVAEAGCCWRLREIRGRAFCAGLPGGCLCRWWWWWAVEDG